MVSRISDASKWEDRGAYYPPFILHGVTRCHIETSGKPFPPSVSRSSEITFPAYSPSILPWIQVMNTQLYNNKYSLFVCVCVHPLRDWKKNVRVCKMDGLYTPKIKPINRDSCEFSCHLCTRSLLFPTSIALVSCKFLKLVIISCWPSHDISPVSPW